MTAYDLSELRVLIVDDNTHMCRLTRTMLGGFGMRKVAEAHDGAEGLERIDQGHFDIIIMDWEMPVLDGPGMIRFLRTPKHPMAYVPIIMITGYSTMRRTQEALNLGINDVLSKPFSPAALYARILDAVVSPRPFLRTETYFGPKPRVSPDDPSRLSNKLSVPGTEESSKSENAFDLDSDDLMSSV